jgi:acyl carrier protein
VAERLPAHMVPHRIIGTSALPFTASGKLDRRSLELEAHESSSRPGRPPSSALERAIAAVFSEVLDTEVEDVSRTFFQLGGQSLLATLAIARLREALQVELPVETFFERASVAELALAVNERRDPVEAERVAELFLLVQGLPDEAVERFLQGRAGT